MDNTDDKKWVVFVSYSYDISSGYFKAKLVTKKSFNGYNKVIIGEDLIPTDFLSIQNTSLAILREKTLKIIECTRKHIEKLKQSINNLPICEEYEL